MEEILEVSMLLDFYGQLITRRQYEILDLHYNNDYSLSEIAQEMNISRQGVYDNIKRGKAALNELEEKLKLIRRFTEQKKKAKVILGLLEEIENSKLEQKCMEKLENAKKAVVEIMED
jgi:Uncharacterized protein conserved in bacteria